MSDEYHKIPTIWKRGSEKPCPIRPGVYATPELQLLTDIEWQFEEKVDGTNVRVEWDPGAGPGPDGEFGEVRFKGRTERAQMPTGLLTMLTETFTQGRLADFDSPTTFYGEGFGAGIQKRGADYIPQGVGFCLFDVRINDLWLERDNVRDIARKLRVPSPPPLGSGTLWDASGAAEGGIRSLWGDFDAEGIVARPYVELQDRRGQRIIAKIKTRDFRA